MILVLLSVGQTATAVLPLARYDIPNQARGLHSFSDLQRLVNKETIAYRGPARASSIPACGGLALPQYPGHARVECTYSPAKHTARPVGWG